MSKPQLKGDKFYVGGKRVGSLKEGVIRDSRNGKLGVVKGENIYDARNRVVAKVRGSGVVDPQGHKLASVSLVQKLIDEPVSVSSAAALWLFFLR